MKKLKQLLAAVLLMLVALCLFTACGSKEEEEPEVDTSNRAAAGGEIIWPEEMDTTVRFANHKVNDTLYIVFNGVQNRTSGYFEPAGSSVTITSYANTESEKRKEYRITLWKETYNGREYVTDGTLYYTADGSCYTGTFEGLEAGARYKIGLAYDGGSYYMSGGLLLSGLAGAEEIADSESAA